MPHGWKTRPRLGPGAAKRRALADERSGSTMPRAFKAYPKSGLNICTPERRPQSEPMRGIQHGPDTDGRCAGSPMQPRAR
jgi:hypothetical protein